MRPKRTTPERFEPVAFQKAKTKKIHRQTTTTTATTTTTTKWVSRNRRRRSSFLPSFPVLSSNLPRFSKPNGMRWPISTDNTFYRVLLGFASYFYRVLLGFSKQTWTTLDFTEFFSSLIESSEIFLTQLLVVAHSNRQHFLPSFTGFR